MASTKSCVEEERFAALRRVLSDGLLLKRMHFQARHPNATPHAIDKMIERWLSEANERSA